MRAIFQLFSLPLGLGANEEISVEFPGGIIEMVRIEAGTFLMGTPTELIEEWRQYNKEQRRIYPTSHKEIWYSGEWPQHPVTITKPFYLGRYEVNRGQWYAIMDPDNEVYQPENPISRVSWLDIQDYLMLLNQQSDLYFRLPTEAEWEYAARAGTATLWWTGDDEEEAGANNQIFISQPNPWGLVRILGGVMEFVADGEREYEDRHEIDPMGPDPRDTTDLCGILRGGDDLSYGYVAERSYAYPYYARSANRMYQSISTRRLSWTGFRLLLEEKSLTSVRENESWRIIKKREHDKREESRWAPSHFFHSLPKGESK